MNLTLGQPSMVQWCTTHSHHWVAEYKHTGVAVATNAAALLHTFTFNEELAFKVKEGKSGQILDL